MRVARRLDELLQVVGQKYRRNFGAPAHHVADSDHGLAVYFGGRRVRAHALEEEGPGALFHHDGRIFGHAQRHGGHGGEPALYTQRVVGVHAHGVAHQSVC
ncbi:MAG: hypothetical protein ACK55Z_33985, partial [bacterium]